MLSLYPANLPNLLTSNVFLGWVFWVFVYKIIPPANNNIIYFFLIWMPFMSLFCLIVLGMTSSATLSKSGESGHLCCLSDLKDFRPFTVKCDVICGLVICAFMMLWYVPYVSNLLSVFNYKRMLCFVKCILYIFWDIHLVFIFHSINVCVTFFYLCMLTHFHSMDKSSLVMMYNLFNVVLDSVW